MGSLLGGLWVPGRGFSLNGLVPWQFPVEGLGAFSSLPPCASASLQGYAKPVLSWAALMQMGQAAPEGRMASA